MEKGERAHICTMYLYKSHGSSQVSPCPHNYVEQCIIGGNLSETIAGCAMHLGDCIEQ